MRVQATTEFDYAGIGRKADDVFEMEDAHAALLQRLGKVLPVQERASSKAYETAAVEPEQSSDRQPKKNTYKTRRLQADE